MAGIYSSPTEEEGKSKRSASLRFAPLNSSPTEEEDKSKLQPDGEVQRGRGLNEKGAHVESANEDNVGICLIGNGKFTRNQWDVLRHQLDSLCRVYGILAKTCPNVSINKILAWFTGHHEKALAEHTIAS